MGGEEGEVGEIEDGEAGRALEQLLDLLVTLCERDRSGLSLVGEKPLAVGVYVSKNVGKTSTILPSGIYTCISDEIWREQK